MVSKFVQPDSTTQTGTTYKGSIDAAVAVLAEQAAQFAINAQDTPNLTVAMRAGRIAQANGTTLAVAAQNSAALTAPATNPRNDVVYYDATTGAIGVAAGTEAASPVDPAIPANKVQAARIRWTVGMASIANSAIDDLRSTNMPQAAQQFMVGPQPTPNLTVAMRAGRLFLADRSLVSVAAQNSAALTAPTVNPRKDIVYIDATTGAIGVAAGAEAASPADPAIPANKIPKARINWTVGMSSIANSAIDDLRSESVGPAYETGTFTPVAAGATTAGSGTYVAQVGRYTRIGRLVFIYIDLDWSAHTGSGLLRIQGLPFTPAVAADLRCVPKEATGVAFSVWSARCSPPNPYFELFGFDQNSGANSLRSLDSDDSWHIDGCYEV